MGIQFNRLYSFKWILIILIFQFNCIYGNKIDSLNNLLSETNEIERKIELYTLLVKQYQSVDNNKAFELTTKALDLSLKTNTTRYLGEIYALFGDIAVTRDSLEVARNNYLKALEFFDKNNDYESAAGVTMVLGNIANIQYDLALAMQNYLQTIEYSKLSNSDRYLSNANFNIGTIYYKTGEYHKALEYYTISLEESRKYGNKLLEANSYENLGEVYISLEEPEMANSYLNKALKYFLTNNFNIRASQSYHNLAEIDTKNGDYQSALDKLNRAKTLLDIGSPNYAGPVLPELAYNNISKGINYLELHNYGQAKQYLMNGLIMSKKTGQLVLTREALNYLSDYWEKSGNIDSAYFYFKSFKTYTDSLNNEKNIRKLAFLEARYQYEQNVLIEKQEREKKDEKHRINLIILLSFLIGLFFLVILLILLLKLSRNKARQAEMEQENLRNKLDLRNKELTTQLMYQVKNNEFILKISQKLTELLQKATPENKTILNELIREIEKDGSTSQWDNFEIRFHQVHTGFYKNLTKQYPDLTSNELRLCAFLRLNMNTKDIASITYQTTNSITVARWRLRQKFGLKKEESLPSYLSQF